MRNVGIILIIVLIALLTFLTFTDWELFKPAPVVEEVIEEPAPVDTRNQSGDMNQAEQALRRGQYERAQEIAENYIDLIEAETPSGRRWGHILVAAAAGTHDIGQLQVLYFAEPNLFNSHEQASLLVGESLLSTGNTEAYGKLRDSWLGKEKQTEAWTILDSDRMLLEGDRAGAAELLGSRLFTGEAEFDRLMRLALITAPEDPKAAWRYFTRAEAKDPENGEVHLFKGKLLESVGKQRHAQLEYETAVSSDPSNALYLDQLAEFYRRQNQPQQALATWTESINESTPDFIWLKALFWNKVLTPVQSSWNLSSLPQGQLRPLLAYIAQLPTGTYWNQGQFEKLPMRRVYLDNYQATYWLQTLEALRQGNNDEAEALLKTYAFADESWNPELEYLLKQTLSYQLRGSFDTNVLPPSLGTGEEKHPYLAAIEAVATTPDAKVPPGLEALLNSKEAPTAALLAAGWNEAAIQLHRLPLYPASFPSWVAPAMTQAIQDNRGVVEALDFAVMQPKSDKLQLVIGELMVTGGDQTGALEALLPISTRKDQIGYRAAWMASLLYLEQHQPHKAKEVLYSQPLLYHDVIGKETLARVALMEGNKPMAEEIYEKIAEQSEEAKSYLARQAFLQKDWERAKRYTRQLVKLHPQNAQLQKNLERIIREQNRALGQ